MKMALLDLLLDDGFVIRSCDDIDDSMYPEIGTQDILILRKHVCDHEFLDSAYYVFRINGIVTIRKMIITDDIKCILRCNKYPDILIPLEEMQIVIKQLKLKTVGKILKILKYHKVDMNSMIEYYKKSSKNFLDPFIIKQFLGIFEELLEANAISKTQMRDIGKMLLKDYTKPEMLDSMIDSIIDF